MESVSSLASEILKAASLQVTAVVRHAAARREECHHANKSIRRLNNSLFCCWSNNMRVCVVFGDELRECHITGNCWKLEGPSCCGGAEEATATQAGPKAAQPHPNP